MKLRLAMTCLAERGSSQSNEPVTWHVARQLKSSSSRVRVPTVPHLNTKNIPSVSRDLQAPWTVAVGREVPYRAVRMGLSKSQGIDKQHFCWSIIRKCVECHKKAHSDAIRRPSKAASLPR